MTNDRKLAELGRKYRNIGCEVYWIGNCLIVDRLPFRSVKAAKNCRFRWQVLDSSESLLKLCRSIKAAKRWVDNSELANNAPQYTFPPMEAWLSVQNFPPACLNTLSMAGSFPCQAPAQVYKPVSNSEAELFWSLMEAELAKPELAPLG